MRSSTKITGAVKEVASTADNNREEAGRALEGAVCLSDLTMRMQDLISRFKLIPA